MSEFEQIATIDEVPPGGRKSVVIDETPALLLHIGNDFYAIEDVCTHDGQPLTDGPLKGCEITCPRHGARFDVRTGKPLWKAKKVLGTFFGQPGNYPAEALKNSSRHEWHCRLFFAV